MRFVAQNSALRVGIRPEKTTVTRDGEHIVRQEGITAEFRAWSFSQRDLEVALGSFQFRGLYQNEDQATLVDPAYRLSTYDTDEEAERWGWDEETKAFVERRLLEAGSFGEVFTIVPELEIAPPWPKYNDFDGDADALVLFVHNLGLAFEEVLAYEESKWGPQRADFIEALQTAIQVRDSDKVVLVS